MILDTSAHVPVHPAQLRRHHAHRRAGDQERDAKAQRIDQQQERALRRGRGHGSHRVDRAEHRADARDPARREEDAHREGRQVTPAPVDLLLDASLGVHDAAEGVDALDEGAARPRSCPRPPRGCGLQASRRPPST